MAGRAGYTAILVAFAVTIGLTQERPNFAGTWTPVEGVKPVLDLVITQTAVLLTAKAGDAAAHVGEYRLDGQENRQREGNVRTRTQWEGNRLLVTHSFMANDAVVRVQKQVWSLDSAGRLVIETIRERDGKSHVTKSIYTRRG